MPDPTTFPEEHVSAPATYRRLSLFAVASLVLAVAFTAGGLVAWAWCLRQRAPLLLPIWIQAAPVLAGLLALIALFLIRRAEGTLAGRGVAVWGFWLSVVSGLVYWAYLSATYTAIKLEAEHFVLGWFDKIKAGELAQAFLEAQTPSRRAKIDPSDENKFNDTFKGRPRSRWPEESISKMPLDMFRGNGIVRLVDQCPNVQIKPLDLKEWEYSAGRYQLNRLYQVSNDEGVYLVSVTVAGSEATNEEFQGRQWQILLGPGSDTKTLHAEMTPLGKKLEELRGQSRQFVEQWSGKLPNDLAGAYAETVDPGARAQLELKISLPPLGAILAAPPADGVLSWPMAACRLALDQRRLHIRELLRRSHLVQTDELHAPSDQSRAVALAGVESAFGGPKGGAALMSVKFKEGKSIRHWEYVNNRLRISHDVQLLFAKPGPKGRPMLYPVEATLTAESDPGPGPLESRRAGILWRVARLDLTYAGEMDSAIVLRGKKPPPGLMQQFEGRAEGQTPAEPPGRPKER